MARSRWTNEAHVKHTKRYACDVPPKEGDWLRHGPTNTWFEFFSTVGGIVVGLRADGGDVAVPADECYHAWDPMIDARETNDA